MTTGIAVGQANAILDAICRSVAYSDPAAFYIKLHSGDPGSAGASNAFGDTTRKLATFGAAAGGTAATTGDITWTALSAGGTISHVSCWSASSGGTFLLSDQLLVSRVAIAGDDLTFAAGQITVTLGAVAA